MFVFSLPVYLRQTGINLGSLDSCWRYSVWTLRPWHAVT